jgi:hypothetical protein
MYCPRPIHPSSPRDREPIRTEADARALLSLAIARPPRHETLAFLLDDAGFGTTMVVVSGTERAEQVLDVVEHLAAAGATSGIFTSLVVASVRPGGGVQVGDIDRWFDASDVAAAQGIELVEWFVVGDQGFACPRDLLGEPARWPV